MPIGPDPFATFLANLQDFYAANPASASSFRPGAQGVPAAPGTSESEGGALAGGTVGGLDVGGFGGAGGASVPGTATTGQSILENIVSGQLPVESPAGQDLVQRLGGQNQPGEIGDTSGITGGDAEILAMILGGPAAVPLVLSSLVLSDALGLPPDPTLVGTTSLAQLVAGGDPAPLGPNDIPFSQRLGISGNTGNLPTPSTNLGPLDIPFAERQVFTPPTTGLGTRLGSGGGSGGSLGGVPQGLTRERTTGRVAGPV